MSRGHGFGQVAPGAMTLGVVFRRAAKSEFEDAAVRCDEQVIGLGDEFIVEMEQAFIRAAAGKCQVAIGRAGARDCGSRRNMNARGLRQRFRGAIRMPNRLATTAALRPLSVASRLPSRLDMRVD